MAFISPRIAHNLAKNGYYPTDDETISGIINCFDRVDEQNMRVLDPCVGEGIAVSRLAYSICSKANVFGVEFNEERAKIAEKQCDNVLRSDLFDTFIAPQSFGLIFLNPPYGDLTRENTGAIVNYQKDYKRLEKIFYRYSIPLLQYDGVLVMIIPFTQLDEMLSNWITNQFTDINVFTACDKQFKQIIIIGKKVRQTDIVLEQKNKAKSLFKLIYEGYFVPEEIGTCTTDLYTVPEPKDPEIKAFYKLSFTQDEFENGLEKSPGLWADRNAFTQSISKTKRQPLRQMSDWHLALALAAGEISGVVTSKTGKTYVIKGDTYKIQTKITETKYDEDDSTNMEIVTTLTDKFIPSIKAWDFTSDSNSFGSLLVISNQTNIPNSEDEEQEPISTSVSEQSKHHFDDQIMVGRTVCTKQIKSLCDQDFNIALAVSNAFTRYQKGDWGEMAESDKKLNDRAVKQGQKGDRLFASYKINDDIKLWIITEWHGDEQGFITTFMLPSEY